MADNSLGAKTGVPVVVPFDSGPQSYTPTFTGAGTVTNINVTAHQRGTTMRVFGTFKTGTTTAVLFKISLPGNLGNGSGINTALYTQSQNTLGVLIANGGAASGMYLNGFGMATIYDSSDANAIFVGYSTDTIANDKLINATIGSTLFAAGTRVAFWFEYEVNGASSQVAYGAGLATSVKAGLTPATATLGKIRVNTSNGYGSTNTVIRRFTTTIDSVGTDITYADSATLGATFTINTAGVYTISYTDRFSTGSSIGVSKNSASLTTNIVSIAQAERISITTCTAANFSSAQAVTSYFAAGDVLRAHGDAATDAASPALVSFTIQRIA